MKLISAVLVSTITFSMAGAGAAATEKYLEAESSGAADPWEVSDSSGASGEKVARVPPGITRNDNPEELGSDGEGTIRFSLPSGEVSADALQYFTLRYRSTDYGNDSVYLASEDGSFVKHDLPIGNEFQWLNTEISRRSAEDGSVELAVMYREAGAELDGVFVSDNPEAVPSTSEPGGSEPAPPPTEPDPVISPPSGDVNGVREYPAIGIKKWPRGGPFNAPRGWLTGVWNEHMSDAIAQSPHAFSEHVPAMTTRIKWKKAYVDPNIKPTREQARDPNWNNYIWNQPGSPGDGAVWDGITDALNSPQIDNGNGPGKLMIIIALTMTTSHDSPPDWMRKDPSLTWDAKGSADGNFGKAWHVRFDNPVAVNHAADFMTAVLAKYGNNKGVQSIQLGEYYLGPKDTRPSDLNRNRYFQGMKELWERTSAAAPIDSNGTRVKLAQVSPALEGGVTLEDLGRAGFGMTQSDMDIHLPVAGSPSEKLLAAYQAGIHVSVDGDARYSCTDRRQGWDGTPNPFGHNKGFSGIATPLEYFWYHSEKGPVPAHSIFITIAPNSERCKGSVQTKASWLKAIETFGRAGSKADSWGVAPAGM